MVLVLFAMQTSSLVEWLAASARGIVFRVPRAVGRRSPPLGLGLGGTAQLRLPDQPFLGIQLPGLQAAMGLEKAEAQMAVPEG